MIYTITEEIIKIFQSFLEYEEVRIMQHADKELNKTDRNITEGSSQRTTEKRPKLDGYKYERKRLFPVYKRNEEWKLIYYNGKNMRKKCRKISRSFGTLVCRRIDNNNKRILLVPEMKR
ncbi:hypothetical protein AVEN_188605-1 [Araneus ventricosus]|uniref:Uncharacterized protein n=1 Tax=Araneus ventricosus TaxID=182803 RepID=A0A4Y2TJV4_ARAVE|nr:hypothetical protein AVEN_188605-1 [Araneus ventricosus]